MKFFFCFSFCGFKVSRTNEKKLNEKKKNMQGRSWMGYCPFSSSGRDIARLYRDTEGHRRAPGHDTTWTACRGAQQRLRDMVQQHCDTVCSARDKGLYRHTIFVSRRGVACTRDTALRHGAQRATRLSARCDMALCT